MQEALVAHNELDTRELSSFERSSDESNRQFLTFILSDEHYGIDILRVQEIKGWTAVTHIPNTPDYFEGVLNLRGTIMPILDLRTCFHMDKVEHTELTVIIVLSVNTDAGQRTIGIVVDGVEDVVDIISDDIKPAPDFGGAVHIEFIKGLVTVDDLMVALLDIDKLLTTEELEGLESLSTD